MPTSLPDETTREILAPVESAGRAWARCHPGQPVGRQPVHTVYGGAHLFRADTARKLGELALRTLHQHAPDAGTLARAIGLDGILAETIYPRIVAKLEREPVEDFRIDFEDGYGYRSDEEEDETAAAAATETARGMAAGTLPPFIGIRIKPFTPDLARRAARTLDLFLTTLLAESGGRLPQPFVVTNPKVFLPEQVAALGRLLDAIEDRTGLAPGVVRMEIMVETAGAILDPRGQAALPALIEAARGRCVAAHFGVYDYTAGLGITALHQSLDHPACDFARHLMQVTLNETDIWLCDGATNVIPGGGRETVHAGWELHYRHVRHSLRHGYYQGWDLNPAQLPTRYAAVYAFFVEALGSATERLHRFVDRAAQATLTGDVFDDAATGQALLNFFLRGLNSGAITEAEALAPGLSLAEIRTRSFPAILAGRSGHDPR